MSVSPAKSAVSSHSNNATANPQNNVPLSCRLSALLQVRDRLAGAMGPLQEDIQDIQDMAHLEVDIEGDGRDGLLIPPALEVDMVEAVGMEVPQVDTVLGLLEGLVLELVVKCPPCSVEQLRPSSARLSQNLSVGM